MFEFASYNLVVVALPYMNMKGHSVLRTSDAWPSAITIRKYTKTAQLPSDQCSDIFSIAFDAIYNIAIQIK